MLNCNVFSVAQSDVKIYASVAGISNHGFSGRPSNRARLVDMKMFKYFIVSNRMPTGRTPDSHGRFHGAVYTLVARITSLKSKAELSVKLQKSGEERRKLSSAHKKEDESYSGIFHGALRKVRKENGREFVLISPSTVCNWFRYFFLKGSLEHTKLHLHKSDTCSESEKNAADLDSLNASLKR